MSQPVFKSDDIPGLGVQSEEVVSSSMEHDYCGLRMMPINNDANKKPVKPYIYAFPTTTYVRNQTNRVDVKPLKPSYQIANPFLRPNTSMVTPSIGLASANKSYITTYRPVGIYSSQKPLQPVNGNPQRFRLIPMRQIIGAPKSNLPNGLNTVQANGIAATRLNSQTHVQIETTQKVKSKSEKSCVEVRPTLIQAKKPSILTPPKPTASPQYDTNGLDLLSSLCFKESPSSSLCVKRSPENIVPPISPIPQKRSRKQLFVTTSDGTKVIKQETSPIQENGVHHSVAQTHFAGQMTQMMESGAQPTYDSFIMPPQPGISNFDGTEAKCFMNKVDLSDITLKRKSVSPKKPKEEKEVKLPKEPKPLKEPKGTTHLKNPKEKVPKEPKLPKEPKEKLMKKTEFPVRTEEEEENILYLFEKDCFDDEECKYLKDALDSIQNSDEPIPWGTKVPWKPQNSVRNVRVFKSPRKDTGIPNFFDDPDLEGILPNSSGCARSEGFKRLTKYQKHLQRLVDRKLHGYKSMQDFRRVNHNICSTKSERSASGRRIQPSASALTSFDDYFKGKLNYHKKKIKFSKSSIHGWGLFAMENISPDELIIEYIGELIRPAVSDMREMEYEKKGIGASYFFKIDDDAVIDATNHGNFSRFINHSCRPNCYARVMTIDGSKHIYIYSRTYIEAGEELTYDYKFPFEADKIECHCGVKGCRRFLN